VAKAAILQLPKELLEQIYAEVETRVAKKFESRIEELEKKCERLEAERDAWQKRYYKEQDRAQHLQGKLELANAEIAGLKRLVQKQAAQIQDLQKKLYGKTSEVSKVAPVAEPEPKRSRGKQHGKKGFGRKRRDNLEPVDCNHDIDESERDCPKCGLPYKKIGEKVSEQIHVEFKVVRRIHHRAKMAKTCKCPGIPSIKVAPPPDQLFKRSIFSIETWSHVIFDKYFGQRPTNRTLAILETFGLDVSQGTFTNGLRKLHRNQIFKPLIEDIKARVLASNRQQKDETGWKVFQETEGKKGYSWWLWVTRVQDCCLFQIDPSRSRDVAKQTIGADPVVLLTDCLPVYRNMGDNVTNAWCWAHIRRALLELSSFKELKELSDAWVKKVDMLYRLNHLRLSAPTDAMYGIHEDRLKKEIREFERQSKRNAVREGLHSEARRVFKRIASHWKGLTVFVRMPVISMDNNLSEQALRSPVVGRKCYYGSGSHWSAQFAADLFTIFATLQMNGINPRIWLVEYLYAVGRNDCKAPTNAAGFLPWNTPPSQHLLS
jgi:transposase